MIQVDQTARADFRPVAPIKTTRYCAGSRSDDEVRSLKVPDEVDEVRGAGFCGLLVKPVTPLEAVGAVATCLEAQGQGASWIQDLARQVRSR